MVKENFVQMLEKSIKDHWQLPVFSDYKGEPITYSQLATRIARMHSVFRECDIKKGDKIALLGKNSMNWAVTFISVVSYGAVVVPILPDFPAGDVHHIVDHSDAKFLFVAESIFETLDVEKMRHLEAVLSLDNSAVLSHRKKNVLIAVEQKGKTSEIVVNPDDFSLPPVGNDEMFSINYTSGTSGFSKGVMLTHNSLMANVDFARVAIPLKRQDRIVSFLPLAHAYGCAFEFLFPLAVGCHITFLGKIPSPRVILEAFKSVRPALILAVPLIIEKIYRKQIKPMLDKGVVKALTKLPPVGGLIYKKIRRKLVEAFGGNFYEIVIGGAALNGEVEAFLKKIKFPCTIGYGMTECGPLISYDDWKTTKLKSVGKPINYIEVKIDSPDPQNEVGEILVKGENVMIGYYKNEEATKHTLEPDGWMHTGDLGIKDEDGYVFIVGRCKDMILGASGQNIYPEGIEAHINNLPYVQESLVVEKEKKLVALIYPDFDRVYAEHIEEKQLAGIMETNREAVNLALPAFSKISKFEIYPEEFEKTPTKKIKRFLYTIPR